MDSSNSLLEQLPKFDLEVSSDCIGVKFPELEEYLKIVNEAIHKQHISYDVNEAIQHYINIYNDYVQFKNIILKQVQKLNSLTCIYPDCRNRTKYLLSITFKTWSVQHFLFCNKHKNTQCALADTKGRLFKLWIQITSNRQFSTYTLNCNVLFKYIICPYDITYMKDNIHYHSCAQIYPSYSLYLKNGTITTNHNFICDKCINGSSDIIID